MKTKPTNFEAARAVINIGEEITADEIISDDEKTLDLGSDIARMAEAGIPTRIDKSHSHMHHKFAVVDKNFSLTGSFNWTRSASDYNNENLLFTSDPRVVKALGDEFDRLWEVMKPY